jgi:FAD/FMN-containing dehydrogenase
MTTPDIDSRRRDLLKAALAAAAAGGIAACAREPEGPGITDVTQLERYPVDAVFRPHSVDELARRLAGSRGPVSIGGGRYSMGGQVAAAGSLHVDMRALNGLVRLDTTNHRVRVQAGARWRDVQDWIDPHGLSVAVMQSYSNFTVGGSVGVNCHGRYVGKGPLANTVTALQLVTGAGERIELSRARHPDLFGAVLGGYGGMGIVTEVELALDPNERIAREVERVALADYPDFFRERVLGRPGIVLHNADLAAPDFDAPLSVSWCRTEQPLTDRQRLVPRGLDYGREQNLIWAASELPGSPWLRERELTRRMFEEPAVVWRNREASLDTASLEPRTRAMSTYLLQEYFVPVDAFLPFARALARTLASHDVNALNVSIRHSPADAVSLLRWAPREVFSFVVYYKQRTSARADQAAATWTRQLIDVALACGGRYYLPYRLHATHTQFARAYPEAERFRELKHRFDPTWRFRNRLWDKYLS